MAAAAAVAVAAAVLSAVVVEAEDCADEAESNVKITIIQNMTYKKCAHYKIAYQTSLMQVWSKL